MITKIGHAAKAKNQRVTQLQSFQNIQISDTICPVLSCPSLRFSHNSLVIGQRPPGAALYNFRYILALPADWMTVRTPRIIRFFGSFPRSGKLSIRPCTEPAASRV